MKGQAKITKKEINRMLSGKGNVKSKDKFDRKAKVKPYKRQNIDYTKLSIDNIEEFEDE